MMETLVATVFDELLATFRAYLMSLDQASLRGFASGIDWSMQPRALEPKSLPCLRYLNQLSDAAPEPENRLAGLLRQNRETFRWGQTYTRADFGENFIDNYGWLEVFGTRGHFANDATAGGLMILGPNIVYPDHHHIAEEIYVPLTGGAEWRMGEGGFRAREAGEIIHHPSNANHATRTRAEPLLALYLWRGGPLAAKSTITGTVAQGRG
jgi:Dimethlysulfonioproprionate lyase